MLPIGRSAAVKSDSAVAPETPASDRTPARLRAIVTATAPPETSVPSLSKPFPRPLTSLIGRDDDVAAALALLTVGETRLLTLTGPGGVGKTRLALRIGEETAAAFPDGVVFVPLATIVDPDLVLPIIGRQLGLHEADARSPAARVTDYLRDKRLLLVLDNFEQVRAAAAELASLLAECPDVSLLVTSRAPLHLAGEQRYPVAPLALPDDGDGETARRHDGESETRKIGKSAAVQLFVARTETVDPRFALDAGNAADVAAICRRLDGLPLAIELAAARSGVLSPAALRARLDPALPLLTGGPEDAPDRLRTMRRAIAWSYDLLSPEEQALFRWLSIFVGGFTLEAAEWVAGQDGKDGRPADSQHPTPSTQHLPPTTHDPRRSTLDLITSLIDTSLVRRDEGSAGTRFGMLETVREFGREALAASGEAEEIAARHVAWCIDLADAVRQSGRLSHRQGLADLEAEHPNLRAALVWLLERGKTQDALHLSGQLAEFWIRHNHWTEGEAWLTRVLAADDGAPTVARSVALTGLNMMFWAQGRLDRARQALDEAESIARAVGDEGALAYARLHQGYVAAFAGDLDLAAARGEEALVHCEAIPQEFSCNGARWLLARAALARGDDERATELHERLLTAARVGGDDISIANSLYGLSILAERRGEHARALAGFAETAVVCRDFGDKLFATHGLFAAADNAAALSQWEPAVRLFSAVGAARAEVEVHWAIDLRVDPRPHEQAWEAARTALGEERFAAAWEAGAALSLDEAIAEATALAQSLVAADAVPSTAGRLTSREQDVVRLLVAGMSDKEIAAALGIGRRTVSNHVATIRAKLGAPSRTAAAAIAVRDHLV
jgi:non-specific serine/threonine protein kinase